MKSTKKIWALVAALTLCSAGAFAQDQKQDTPPVDYNTPLQPLEPTPAGGYASKAPIGAARGVSATSDSLSYDPSQVKPDQNTLAGAAPFTLGSLQHSRNIFDPAITVSQLGQMIRGTTGESFLTGVTVADASLDFNRIWGGYHFSTIYNGGETFNMGFGALGSSYGKTAPHYQFHDLFVSQEADWGRWHILLRDDFAASPGAAFTNQGAGGPGLAAQFSTMLGTSLNSFSQSFVPSETINTGPVMRERNAFLGQAEYSFSRRSAITFSGSYGLLHFATSGYFDSTLLEAQAGYDYLLDPSNSIAVLGSFGKINYTGTANAIVGNGNSTMDYLGALAYGRKITGRLAFQVAAGPQEIMIGNPGGVGNFHVLFASVNSTLSYERRRGGVSVGYLRGLTGGSGVLLGATGNTFNGSGHYQLTRNWIGSANGGYALNNSLGQGGVPIVQFNNWFFGANLGRRVGSHAQFNLNYGASKQDPPATCPVSSCGGTGLQQTFGMSVNWHVLPMGEGGR